MGALTMAEMQTLVKRTANNRTDLDTEIAQSINQAYLETSLIRGIHFNELDKGPFTFNTVNNTRQYAFNSMLGGSYESRDIISVYGLYNTTSKMKLTPHSIEWFDKLDQTVKGKPSFYAHFGSYIELHQTPDAAYAMRFRVRYRPDRLVAGASTVTLLPEEFDMPIVWYAGSMVNSLIGNLDKSSFYLSMRREALANISTSLESSDDYEDFALGPEL